MPVSPASEARGSFVTIDGERYYGIGDVDALTPFFISLVSDGDHWAFVASNGGLTAGRMSPESALFPYLTVDKIYDSTPHTGSTTLVRAGRAGDYRHWEPFNREHDGRHEVTRNLFKSVVGNKLLFEEVNHELKLAFRYRWCFSDAYGFVRQAELANLGTTPCRIELVDGLQNILPAGTPRFAQTNTSNLVDAYKWSEIDGPTGLGLFTLYSGISDRAEPCESLRATTVFALGLEEPLVLLSTAQLDRFRGGEALVPEALTRGVRGAYLVHASLEIGGRSSHHWQVVADVEKSQASVVSLLQELAGPGRVADAIARSIERGTDALSRMVGMADGHQKTAEETVTAHHQASVLFNILRGGVVSDQYLLTARDFRRHVEFFNREASRRHGALLEGLPARISHGELRSIVEGAGDPQLLRLTQEFLPITFGRRHGDPSRPWNQFSIRLLDREGNRLLNYQGNWRDIFQNWEALLLGYPELIEDVIAKFVNASTVEGYNPYRISNEGIDWEVEHADDPWSYVGYWGDHQIIYLQKLLELSDQFHPGRLAELLHRPLFSYANVPYRIRPFDAIIRNAKATIEYDSDLELLIRQRVAGIGGDGKLLLDANGEVQQVTLLEKLLVTLLGKIANFVPDGGIWLNTQRPEWNDANNALVGQGLSMVTLYYLRRYIRFLQRLLEGGTAPAVLSAEVREWLLASASALRGARAWLGAGPVDARRRYGLLAELGEAASRYRETVYARQRFAGRVSLELEAVDGLLDDAMAAIDHSIRNGVRPDGLFHAYNLLALTPGAAGVDPLYLMLEGQVAVLSSGAIGPVQAVRLLEGLFASELFRSDQQSFLLYPDRDLPRFLEKNRVPPAGVAAIPLLQAMQARGDTRIIGQDAAGTWRFNGDLTNVGQLDSRLAELLPAYGELVEGAREALRSLYESVFNHRAFTGRSGGMFGFEGLGCIYWHMVSKLLLAVQECFYAARDEGADEATCRQLGSLYYRVREGMGFNKTPTEFGAFPTDPYSHTPRHAGAQQPGMTGAVKEDILTRMGELGVRVSAGSVRLEPVLLRSREFLARPEPFRVLEVDGQWQEITVPAGGLAFTVCQVPVVYRLVEAGAPTGVVVTRDDGVRQRLPTPVLPADVAREIFGRSGRIRRIELDLSGGLLLGE